MKISGIYRTTLLLILHLVGIFVHSVLLASGEAREACRSGSPLYDVIHDYSSQGIWPFSQFQNINHGTIITVLTVLLIFVFIRHSQRQLLFRRFLLFHSVMSILRGVFIWVTTIPSPTSLCFDRLIESNEVLSRSLTLTLGAVSVPYEWYGIGTPGITCCDSIISGHTSMLLVLTILLVSVIKNRMFRISIITISTFAMLGLITTEWHYTIDILVPLVIGIALYNWYILKVKHSPNVFTTFIEEPNMYPAQNGLMKISLKELFWLGNK